jgi:hypothetical protein
MAAATSRATSSTKVIRFSIEPPQASVRRLVSGLRNCSMR